MYLTIPKYDGCSIRRPQVALQLFDSSSRIIWISFLLNPSTLVVVGQSIQVSNSRISARIANLPRCSSARRRSERRRGPCSAGPAWAMGRKWRASCPSSTLALVLDLDAPPINQSNQSNLSTTVRLYLHLSTHLCTCPCAFSQTVGQSVSQSVTHLDSQSLSQPVTQSVGQPVAQPLSHCQSIS